MNDNNMHTYPKVSAGCLAAMLLCLSLVNLSAQTSTAPAVLKPEQVAAPAEKTITAEEDILQLNPFVVTTSEDRGYSSASTLSGTRLDTPAKFVPAAISEVNKALMEDLGQFNMMELVDFTTNSAAYDNSRTGSFSDSGQNSSFVTPFQANIRGASVQSTSRDFFVTRVQDDGYNTDRVSVNRGPNSILFGFGSPFGIVNAVSNWATMKNSYQVAIRADNWGSRRASIRLNRQIIQGKVAVHFAALHEDRSVNLKPSNRVSDRAYGAVTINPFKKTVIRASFEHGLIDNISARAQPSLQDGLSAWIAAGYQELPPELQNGGARFGTFLTKTPAQTAQQTALNTQLDSLGFQLGSAGNTQKVTTILNSRSPMPWMASLGVPVTKYSQGVGIAKVKNATLVDSPIPYTVNVLGVNSGFRQHFQNHTVIVDQHVGEHLFVEAIYNRQNSNYLARNLATVQNNWLGLDKNPTLVTAFGQVIPNPNYNRYFVGYWNSGFIRRYNDDENLLIQAAYKFDFERHLKGRLGKALGRHNIVGLAQRSLADVITNASQQPKNSTPEALRGKIPQMPDTYFTRINAAANNPLMVVMYIDPADSSTWVAPDLQKVFGPYKSYFAGTPLPPAHPSGVTPIYQTASSTRNFQIVDSKAFVLQSYFWDERIATTFGWREDVAVNRAFTSSAASAVTYNGMTGWQANVGEVDRYKGNQNYPLIYNKVTGRTYTAGVVAYPLPWFGVFYNQSKNFGLVGRAAAIDIFGDPLPPSSAVGKDWGVRLSLWKGKIDLNIGQYNTVQTNVPNGFFRQAFGGSYVGENVRVIISDELFLQTDDPKFTYRPWVAQSQPQNWNGIGNAEAKGYEVSLSANPTRNWRITASFAKQSNVPSEYGAKEQEWYDWALDYVKQNYPQSLNISSRQGIRNVLETLAEDFQDYQTVLQQMKSLAGRRDSRQPEYTGSLVTGYDFTRGLLKGSGIGGSYRYRGRTAIGYAFLPGSTTLFDPNKPFYASTLNPVGVFAYHKFKIGEKVRCRVQFNADNINGNEKLTPWLATDDGTGKPVIVNYAVGSGKTYALSATFDF